MNDDSQQPSREERRQRRRAVSHSRTAIRGDSVSQSPPASNAIAPPPRDARVQSLYEKHTLACRFRSIPVGKGECGCSSKPDVFLCTHPEVKGTYCLLHRKTLKSTTVTTDGEPIILESVRLDCCKFCNHRQASEVSDAPFLKTASDKVVSERTKACESCKLREKCGLPVKWEAGIEWASVCCPAGLWKE